MSTIEFKVIAPRARKPQTTGPTFVLEQDNWNDYNFETQYQLYYFPNGSPGAGSDDYIGAVKILRKGQTPKDSRQITTDVTQLGPEFCSVGESLDYYKRLSTLGSDVRNSVLEALRDVVYSPALVGEFSSEAGWGKSLFRDQSDQGHEFRLLAGSMLSGDYTSVPADDLSFTFKLPHWATPVGFSFKSPTIKSGFFEESLGLPGRIVVVVGQNGSGKSTLLARLARVAFGTVGDRTEAPLKELGEIEPCGIGFPRIVNITFSPFDSFRLPADGRATRRVVAKETTEGEGRFVFIGLRDISKEKSTRPKSSSDGSTANDPAYVDRLEKTALKSIDQLANEFSNFVAKIEEKKRGELFKKVLNTVLPDAALSTDDESELDIVDARSRFFRSSTGHKIALLMTAGLIAHIEPRSLVLIDEPETHLHPPLLAALMHALRRILEVHKAFAIVATHSPVIVQETLAQHVRVIRREGEVTDISPVRFETFGENIGLISQEVFLLSAETTDFHKALKDLALRYDNLDQIEALFQDGAMSQQARAYVMSQLALRKKG